RRQTIVRNFPRMGTRYRDALAQRISCSTTNMVAKIIVHHSDEPVISPIISAMLAGSYGLSARVVVATVRGDEHGDGRPAIGFDFVLCSRLIEACDHQEIGSFEKRGKQAGGPERIGHVQKRLR